MNALKPINLTARPRRPSPNYACRNNETFSLIPLNGQSRAERFCPTCEALKEGTCVFYVEQRLQGLRREVQKKKCTKCSREHYGEFQQCRYCRAKNHIRTQRRLQYAKPK